METNEKIIAQIISYIKERREEQDIQDDELKSELLRVGVEEADIDQAFFLMYGRTPVFSSGRPQPKEERGSAGPEPKQQVTMAENTVSETQTQKPEQIPAETIAQPAAVKESVPSQDRPQKQEAGPAEVSPRPQEAAGQKTSESAPEEMPKEAAKPVSEITAEPKKEEKPRSLQELFSARGDRKAQAPKKEEVIFTAEGQKRKKWPLVIPAVLLLMVFLGIGGWYAYKNGGLSFLSGGDVQDEPTDQLPPAPSLEELLRSSFENFKTLKTFGYREIFSRADIEEDGGIESIKKTYTEEERTSEVIVAFPDKADYKSGLTQVVLAGEDVYIKNDPVLAEKTKTPDIFWQKFSTTTITKENMLESERLPIELINTQFSWLNPDIIKSIEQKETMTENGESFLELGVKYDVEKLAFLWKDTMNTMIQEAYLPGISSTDPEAVISITGMILISEKTYLPAKITIKKDLKKKRSEADSFDVQRVKLDIGFYNFNAETQIVIPNVYSQEELNPSLCSGISDAVQKSACIDYIITKTKNPLFCNEITSEKEKYSCYLRYAVSFEDPAVCGMIISGPRNACNKDCLDSRNICYNDVAVKTKKAEICAKITNANLKKLCAANSK